MNRTTVNTAERRSGTESTAERSMRGRKKVNNRLLGLMRGAMLVLIGLIAVLGLLLMVLPMFRVKTIHVKGVSDAEAAVIIEELNAYIGEEVLAVNSNDIRDEHIYAPQNMVKFGYIKSFKLHRGLSSITVEVLERDNPVYTKIDGVCYLLSSDFYVLSATENEADFASFPRVELPAVRGVKIGAPLWFENENVDLSYVNALRTALRERGLEEQVTSMDLSKKYSVSYVLDGSCRVELGSVEKLELKLRMVDEILSRQGEGIDEHFVVDVSDLGKPTYRPLSAAEVLMG